MIEALFLRNDGETWDDAGAYDLKLTAKFATLERTRPPKGYVPGAIAAANRVKMVRENWDAGKRYVYPQMAGVPLVFLATGAKDYQAPESMITAEDIRAMF